MTLVIATQPPPAVGLPAPVAAVLARDAAAGVPDPAGYRDELLAVPGLSTHDRHWLTTCRREWHQRRQARRANERAAVAAVRGHLAHLQRLLDAPDPAAALAAEAARLAEWLGRHEPGKEQRP